MTYTTLASHCEIPLFIKSCRHKIQFGFFVSEEEVSHKIATELGLTLLNEHPLKYARHPLVYLVEAADDICYQMMDIEDAHKLKILTTEETKELLMAYFSEERRERIRQTFLIVSDTNEQIAYLRSSVIGLLIRECTRVFLEHEAEILSGTFEGALIKHISERPAKRIQALRRSIPEKDLPVKGCTGHRVSRFPRHQYLAGTDDRCGNLSRKGLFRVAHQSGFKPV